MTTMTTASATPPQAPVRTPVQRRRRASPGFTAKRLALLVSGIAVALFFLLPYVHMLMVSLKPRDELFGTPTDYTPQSWEWSNYVNVWDFGNLSTNLVNSLLISLLSTLLVLVVSLPAAYYTARHKFFGRGAFLLLVLATQMLAPTSLIIGLHREFLAFGLINTYTALVLINAAFNLPFCTWILHAYFASIPEELEEAAWLDGCSKFAAMTRVTLPLALPGLVTALIFTFIQTWNEYVVAQTLATAPAKQPLTVGITTLIGQYEVQWQYLFAVSLVAILPVVVLFILIERYLVSGLTAGSIK